LTAICCHSLQSYDCTDIDWPIVKPLQPAPIERRTQNSSVQPASAAATVTYPITRVRPRRGVANCAAMWDDNCRSRSRVNDAPSDHQFRGRAQCHSLCNTNKVGLRVTNFGHRLSHSYTHNCSRAVSRRVETL